MTTHDEESVEGAEESLGKQVARTSMLIYQDFKEHGFSGKEAFELTKLWCAPNYTMIVQRMYAEELAIAKREAQVEAKGKPHLHLPKH